MADAPTAVLTVQAPEPNEKYFNFQIKAWTNFNPMDKSIAKIAEAIERGGGFLTLVEVLKVEDNLACIGDEEVRECFANTLAAERLLRNVHELSKNLIEELRSALKTEEEVVPRKTVAPVPISSLSDESGSRAKRWP